MKKATIIVLILIAVSGAAYYFYGFKRTPQNENGGVACTMEALLCPGGSYVGRQGKNCAFRACPGTGPFTGKFEQINAGFRLLMDSPEKSGIEVSYSMPLEMTGVDNPMQFIGKKVQVYGIFTEGVSFRVNKVEPAPLSDATLGKVGVGETTFINGVRITLNKIVQDSRCPINVQCIQAGSVTANVSLKSDTDSEVINIESGKAPVLFDSFAVSLVDTKPLKTAGQAIEPQSYILTFKVISQ